MLIVYLDGETPVALDLLDGITYLPKQRCRCLRAKGVLLFKFKQFLLWDHAPSAWQQKQVLVD